MLLASAPLPALTVSAVGDILLWYGAMPANVVDTPPPEQGPWTIESYPFALVKPSFQGLVFGNQEGPLTDAPVLRFKPKWMRHYFKSPADDSVQALKVAGFRAVSVANNHAMDCGAQGLSDTVAALESQGIHAVGAAMSLGDAQQPVLVDDGQGGQAWFLARNVIGPPLTFAGPTQAGTAKLERDELLAAVKALAQRPEPTIVSLHWGIERRQDLPVAEPEAWQRRLARELVDAGASLVLGAHTHAVGRFEERGRGLIAYSLGNFAFSGGRMQARRRSVILRCQLAGKRVQRWDLVPVYTDSAGHPFQPLPMEPMQGRAYLRKLVGGKRGYKRYHALPEPKAGRG